jgi:hypothetical protein
MSVAEVAAMLQYAFLYTFAIVAPSLNQSSFESWMMHSASIQGYRTSNCLVNSIACWKVFGKA